MQVRYQAALRPDSRSLVFTKERTQHVQLARQVKLKFFISSKGKRGYL